MSLRVGESLSSLNEKFTLTHITGGNNDYSIDDSTKGYIISFIDVKDTNSPQWIARMQNLQDFYDSLTTTYSLEIVCVVYDDTNGESPPETQDISTLITNSGILMSEITYHLLNNAEWSQSPAWDYRGAFTSYQNPFLYILSDDFLIVDKFHYGSLSNGDGTRKPGLDDRDFLNLNWASVVDPGPTGADPRLNKIEKFLERRIEDIIDDSPGCTVNPSPGEYPGLSSIQITYHRKAFAAWKPDSYSLSEGPPIDSVSPSGQINWSEYSSSHEVRTISFTPLPPGASVSLGSNEITDTKEEAFSCLNGSNTYTTPQAVRRKIILVMDFSGSMGWDESMYGIVQPKMDFMRPQIECFMQKLIDGIDADMTRADDVYALVKYESSAEVIQLNGNPTAVLGDPGVDPIALINSLPIGNNTAMGAGLAHAYKLLGYPDSSDDIRAIVMFADGQDNVNPRVMMDSNSVNSFSITNPNQPGHPSGFPDDLNVDINVSGTDTDKIPIHSIGIYDHRSMAEDWLVKLEHLSSGVTGGLFLSMPGDELWPGATENFDEIHGEIYSDSSPQVVFSTQGELFKEERIESFILNRTVQSILVSLSWPGDTELTFSLRRNGREIHRFDSLSETDKYAIAGIHFPHTEPNYASSLQEKELDTTLHPLEKKKKPSLRSIGGDPIDPDWLSNVLFIEVRPEGMWEVVIQRKHFGYTPVPYHVSVLGEETMLKLELEYPHSHHTTGSIMDLGIHIKEAGIPLDEIFDAQVKITKPVISYEAVLNKYQGLLHTPTDPVNSGNHQAIQTIMEQQHKALLKIPQAAAELKAVNVEPGKLVPSVHKSRKGEQHERGRFQAQYTNFDVSGVYTARFVLKGAGKKTGAFERHFLRSFIVKSKIDPELSIQEKSVDPKTGIITLKVFPRDRYGNPTGPGKGYSISGDFTGREDIKVIDHLDGSYTIKIPPIPKKKQQTEVSRLFMDGQLLWKQTKS